MLIGLYLIAPGLTLPLQPCSGHGNGRPQLCTSRFRRLSQASPQIPHLLGDLQQRLRALELHLHGLLADAG